MKNPKISVVTVCYNAVNTIEKTILSVINQTYQNIEYIIIDGASTDGTVDMINKYVDKISYFVSEPDKGIYDAMNKGIDASSGEWINFMNAGDSFAEKNSIEFMSSFFYEAKIVFGNMLRTDGKHTILTKGAHGDNIDAFDFMHASVCHQAAFIKKELFINYGEYDLKYQLAADAEFFFRVLIREKVSYKYIDKTISVFALGGLSSIHHCVYDEERKKFLVDYLGVSTYNRFEELFWLKNCKTAVFVASVKNKIRNILKKL